MLIFRNRTLTSHTHPNSHTTPLSIQMFGTNVKEYNLTYKGVNVYNIAKYMLKKTWLQQCK